MYHSQPVLGVMKITTCVLFIIGALLALWSVGYEGNEYTDFNIMCDQVIILILSAMVLGEK